MTTLDLVYLSELSRLPGTSSTVRAMIKRATRLPGKLAASRADAKLREHLAAAEITPLARDTFLVEIGLHAIRIDVNVVPAEIEEDLAVLFRGTTKATRDEVAKEILAIGRGRWGLPC